MASMRIPVALADMAGAFCILGDRPMNTDRAGGETLPADVALVGANHRAAPAEVCERLARAFSRDRQSLRLKREG